MEYKLLGVKFNVINVILCIALGFLICAMLGYNNKKIIEGAYPKKHRGRRKSGKTLKNYRFIRFSRPKNKHRSNTHGDRH